MQTKEVQIHYRRLHIDGIHLLQTHVPHITAVPFTVPISVQRFKAPIRSIKALDLTPEQSRQHATDWHRWVHRRNSLGRAFTSALADYVASVPRRRDIQDALALLSAETFQNVSETFQKDSEAASTWKVQFEETTASSYFTRMYSTLYNPGEVVQAPPDKVVEEYKDDVTRCASTADTPTPQHGKASGNLTLGKGVESASYTAFTFESGNSRERSDLLNTVSEPATLGTCSLHSAATRVNILSAQHGSLTGHAVEVCAMRRGTRVAQNDAVGLGTHKPTAQLPSQQGGHGAPPTMHHSCTEAKLLLKQQNNSSGLLLQQGASGGNDRQQQRVTEDRHGDASKRATTQCKPQKRCRLLGETGQVVRDVEASLKDLLMVMRGDALLISETTNVLYKLTPVCPNFSSLFVFWIFQ